MRSLHVRRLGLVEYEDGLAAQRLLVAARIADLVPDTLLLLEHPRVITLGRGAKLKNLLLSKEQLAAEGFELHETDRGGDVTYHGPTGASPRSAWRAAPASGCRLPGRGSSGRSAFTSRAG